MEQTVLNPPHFRGQKPRRPLYVSVQIDLPLKGLRFHRAEPMPDGAYRLWFELPEDGADLVATSGA